MLTITDVQVVLVVAEKVMQALNAILLMLHIAAIKAKSAQLYFEAAEY